MDIRHCFETLEIPLGATIAEVKQSYRDLARVWHPDRFSGQPDLQKKTERRLQDINDCYRLVMAFLNAGKTFTSAHSDAPYEPERKEPIRTAKSRASGKFSELSEAADRAHVELIKHKSPYRFCVYQDKGKTFIDVVMLGSNGGISEIRKSNIGEDEFSVWINRIEKGEGLLIDVSS